MRDMEFFEGSLNPANALRSIAYDYRFMCENPFYFQPDGIWLFCGAQG